MERSSTPCRWAFIGWLFVSLNKRIDNLTVRIDKLYELLAAERKP